MFTDRLTGTLVAAQARINGARFARVPEEASGARIIDQHIRRPTRGHDEASENAAPGTSLLVGFSLDVRALGLQRLSHLCFDQIKETVAATGEIRTPVLLDELGGFRIVLGIRGVMVGHHGYRTRDFSWLI